MLSKAIIGARILLGLVFFVFGLNGFLQFIPLPPPSGSAAAFLGGLAAAGYFYPALSIIQTVAGAALLVGRFVPLALVVLAPAVANILAFHLFLDASGIPHATVMALLELFLAWAYRDAFRPLLLSRPAKAVLGAVATDDAAE